MLAALLVVGCVAPVVREKGMVLSLATAAALEAALEPRRRAIVIGIDDYLSPAFPDLKHAVDDAEALADVLRADRGGAFDEVVALTTPEVTTRESIVRALQEARSELRREDELVVYFSGHGTRVRDAERYVRYLLASDSQPSDLDGTALDLVAVQAFFATLAPARKALVVDACFHGEGKSVVRPDPFDGAPVLDDALVPRATTMGPAEAHLFATSPGRPSLESDALGHGVYTNFLLEALTWGLDDADRDEDGVVTVWEAHDHARGRTIAYTNGAQVPEAAFRVSARRTSCSRATPPPGHATPRCCTCTPAPSRSGRAWTCSSTAARAGRCPARCRCTAGATASRSPRTVRTCSTATSPCARGSPTGSTTSSASRRAPAAPSPRGLSWSRARR